MSANYPIRTTRADVIASYAFELTLFYCPTGISPRSLRNHLMGDAVYYKMEIQTVTVTTPTTAA
jgi:hypothetical protein